jgi:hypothetical protein
MDDRLLSPQASADRPLMTKVGLTLHEGFYKQLRKGRASMGNQRKQRLGYLAAVQSSSFTTAAVASPDTSKSERATSRGRALKKYGVWSISQILFG